MTKVRIHQKPPGGIRRRARLAVAGIRLALLAGLLAMAPAANGQEEGRIAAVVNDNDIITVADLNERIKLVVFSTGLPSTAEVRRRIAPQVLQSLIDERLQLQEAETNNVRVAEREIEEVLADMAARTRLPPGGLDKVLAQRGIDKETLVSQIRANRAWGKLVQRRFQRQANVSEEQIDETLRLIEEASDKPRYLVSEIFIAVDDLASEAQVRQSVQRIIQQIRKGGRFDRLAQAFSQNAAAAKGGDLGWLVPGQLDEKLDAVLAVMRPGQISNPIRTSAGYHLLALRDRQLAGGISLDKVTVALKQIMLRLPAKPGKDQIKAGLANAEKIRAGGAGCGAIGKTPLPGKATVIDVGRLKVSDLAGPLQQAVIGLTPGQISEPLQGQGGIMMLMVCDRQAPEAAALPDREAVRNRLFGQKLDLLARRYLRDLRRAAFLDIRV